MNLKWQYIIASGPQEGSNCSQDVKASTMIRGDLSDRLVHLTRGNSDNPTIRARQASQRFWSIVRSGKLIGRDTDIRGRFKCVCFSEAPIGVLTQMLADQRSRYAPLGVMVDKTWLFSKGGRPVIYQPETEYRLLPAGLRYRHVRYDPIKGHDWTWEREWRIKSDAVTLDPAQVTLVIPFRSMADSLREEYRAEQGRAVRGAGSMAVIEKMPWHFLALEDLGLTIDFG